MPHEMDELFQADGGSDLTVASYRRIITGHDEQGRSVFLVDDTCLNVHRVMGLPDFAFTELWKTTETPSRLNDEGDRAEGVPQLAPPAGGSVFRILEMPPDRSWTEKFPNVPVPTMHRTLSVDYAFVIEGEVWAVLDGEERLMREGDILIQCGTNHGWANRSDTRCRILFVLIDAVDNS